MNTREILLRAIERMRSEAIKERAVSKASKKDSVETTFLSGKIEGFDEASNAIYAVMKEIDDD